MPGCIPALPIPIAKVETLTRGLLFDLWPFNFRYSACRGPAMDYMSADFGADSWSHFPFRAWTNDRQTRLNALPHAGGYTAGMAKYFIFQLVDRTLMNGSDVLCLDWWMVVMPCVWIDEWWWCTVSGLMNGSDALCLDYQLSQTVDQLCVGICTTGGNDIPRLWAASWSWQGICQAGRRHFLRDCSRCHRKSENTERSGVLWWVTIDTRVVYSCREILARCLCGCWFYFTK